MSAQKIEGIILRKYYLRETSYILVVYTKELGKIKGVIKGVRNPYPQFAGNFGIFTQCEMLFYKKQKRSMDLISRCETLNPFSDIRKEIERLTYANYFIELVDIVTSEYDPNEGLYDVLLNCLVMLSTSSSAKRIGRIFELKLLDAIGLSPGLIQCVECGSSPEKSIRFNVKSGGILCSNCGRSGINISPGTANFMRKIQTSDLEKTFRIKVSKKVGEETEKVLQSFIAYHVNRPVKSMKFLEKLDKEGII
ncbi:MAG: DNA repair protein RecO [Candidatus Omnitrophica bacterium]|nr:DNA repair protein RecO [Candidatus Omnitrophota bacterium]